MIESFRLDPKIHYLGSLCKRGHDYLCTGKSVRRKIGGSCRLCLINQAREKAKDPKHRKKLNETARRYREKNGRYVLSPEQKKQKVDKQRERVKKFGFTNEQLKNKSRLQYKYKKRKMKNDPYFALSERLRDRVKKGLGRYLKNGKAGTSKEYGIDYKAIIEHIGLPPDNIHKWEVDHIKPLSKFNLEDPEEVKKAFAPKNHQWLTESENRKKGNTYAQ